MEFQGKRILRSFLDERSKEITIPPKLSFRNNQHTFETTSSSSATSIPFSPISPETPWTLSPKGNYSPSPSLLYHCLTSLHRHQATVLSITVSRDFIFTGSESKRIHAWKQPHCTQMGCIKSKFGGVGAILAHGGMLFTSHSDCKVRVWDVSNMLNFRQKKIATIPKRSSLFTKDIHQHKNYISCLAYNHMERVLYTGSWDKTVKAWKILERQCVDSFVAHEGQVNAIVINQHDGCVFTCSSDGSVKIWRRLFGERSHILITTLKFQLSPVNALALSITTEESSSCFLYSGSSDGLINFWEKENMSGRYSHGGFLQGHHFAVLCLVALGDLILSGSEDATIRVWRREEGNCLHTCLSVIEGHHGPVRCLAASLETENVAMALLVYSASLDQTFKAWRVKVFPGEKVNLEEEDEQPEIVKYQISPVLSPTWVERKLQADHFR